MTVGCLWFRVFHIRFSCIELASGEANSKMQPLALDSDAAQLMHKPSATDSVRKHRKSMDAISCLHSPCISRVKMPAM